MAAKKSATASKDKKKPKAKPAVVVAPVKFKEFTISQKRTGRFQVINAKGKNVNGAEKEKILLESKVIKGSFKKAEATAN